MSPTADPGAPEADASPAPELVFVGGTGRSGTHAIARLLGRHSRLADVPIEARFHCNKLGIGDLLEGRVTLASFLAKLRGFWWHRVRVDGRPRGLYNIVLRSEFDAATARFEAAYAEDPISGCRGLVLDLLGGVAERRGKPGLVEMSSHNVRQAQTLLRLFPDARIVHALRDGRDAAASVTGKTWGPDGVNSALEWWAERLRAIDRGVRGEEDGAPYSIPAGRFTVVVLDELVGARREETYAGLLEFLELDDEPAIREQFGSMTPERAHIGRWRSSLGPLGRVRAQRSYERHLDRLEAEGNHAAPPLLGLLGRGAL